MNLLSDTSDTFTAILGKYSLKPPGSHKAHEIFHLLSIARLNAPIQTLTLIRRKSRSQSTRALARLSINVADEYFFCVSSHILCFKEISQNS